MGSVAEDLRRVAAGLRLVFLGLMVVVINAIAVIGVTIAFRRPDKDLAAMFAAIHRDYPTTVMLLIGLGVLSNVLAITGKVYCISVPVAVGASPLIVMAAACSGIGLALNVVGQAGEFGPSAGEISGVSPVFTIAGYFFFLRFLRRLAHYLGSARLVSRAKLVQMASLGLLFVSLAAAISRAAGVINATTGVGLFILAIGGLVLFGLYTLLLHDLRRTVESAASSAELREDETG